MISTGKDKPSFIIDSDHRITGSIENFTCKIKMRPGNQYDSVCMIHCNVPKTYYNVDTDNNEFVLKENGVSRTINLQAGQYTISNFPTYLKLILDNASQAISPLSPWTYAITFSSLDYLWKIEVTEHASRALVSCDINMTGELTSPHEVFGFSEGSENPFIDISGGIGYLYSSQVVNFERTSYITVKSNICNNDGNINTDSTILARFPVRNITFNEMIHYDLTHLEDGMKTLTGNGNDVFSFSIHDDHDRILNLHNRDWFLTLFVFKYNDESELRKLQKEEILATREEKMAMKQQQLKKSIMDFEQAHPYINKPEEIIITSPDDLNQDGNDDNLVD